ncbi:MAG: TetR/AcrR family transcriptional regulator [Methylococcales bacterium]|nr:TetR/AcrR family transcriptional regulator [Methylococcales bacterium]
MTLELVNIKRQSIVEGATRMFLQYGFNASSMDKIAQAAPVSKATLYKYFDSKDALLAAVIENLCLNLFQTVDDASTETESIENTLKKIASAFVDLIFSDDALGMYRLIIAECRDFPKLGQLVYDSAPKVVNTQLITYLDSLNVRNEVTILDANFAADAFISLLKGEFHFQCLLGIRAIPPSEEKKSHVEQVVKLFMQGFIYAH